MSSGLDWERFGVITGGDEACILPPPTLSEKGVGIPTFVNNYSPALQEDARRFKVRLNEAGDISSTGTTVRNKRHAGWTCWS